MRSLVAILIIAISVAVATPGRAQDNPNILWITAEDMSATLGCYGDEYANTPNIDKLATESVRYTNAFATAPVCSPSRSCLITGCYAPSLGTQQMRSAFPIPQSMTGFPSILREQLDYYTSNNVKTDYNTGNWEKIIAASWNESSAEAHWRNRSDPEKKQPFFSVFNLMTSHQSRSMVWPYEQFQSDVQSRLSAEEKHDPDAAPLPPYYVDTPIVRREWARLYDCVTAMDQEVGKILEQLETDGLADDAIVFFYSDHGSGMPRHKRALFDSGMHVPLLIRFPKKYQHLAPSKPGTTSDRLVSFVDFGPTVLSLAEADIPEEMQGQPFLGKANTKPRTHVFGHRDRVDEVRDLARSVRDKRWLYIRNFMPQFGYNQPTSWPDQGDIRHEFYRLTDKEKMTPAQWQFAGPTRPVEELYDCQNDPLNLTNLITSTNPEHQKKLFKMRDLLHRQLLESKDLGFIAESEAWRITHGSTPWEVARDPERAPDFDAILGAARLCGTELEESRPIANLKHEDPLVRYWGALAFGGRDSISEEARETLSANINDESAAVRIEAASALVRHGDDSARATLIKELENDDLSTVLHAVRNLEMSIQKPDDAPDGTIEALRALLAHCEEIRPSDTPPTAVTAGDPDLAMFTMMSANALLKKLDASAIADRP